MKYLDGKSLWLPSSKESEGLFQLNKVMLDEFKSSNLTPLEEVFLEKSLIKIIVEENQGELLDVYIGLGLLNKQDEKGQTILINAARAKNCQIVGELINKGADVNKEDNQGNTALMYSVLEGGVETSVLLLSGNGDINHKNKSGETVLMMAIKVGNEKVVEVLKKYW